MLTDHLAELRLHCPSLADHLESRGDRLAEEMLVRVSGMRSQVMKPRPRMRVDQCSDRFRYIPQEASANHGKFKVSTYEVARGPMMAVTEPGVRIITIAAATQLMKTTMLESTSLYFMLIDPAPVLIVEPNEKSASDLSKTKISGMIKNTPAAKQVIFDDLVERKAYLGGYLKITNAGSETNLAQNAIRVTLLDEIVKYEPLKGGDAVKLAEERTTTFGERALNVRVCSPRFDNDAIWKSYLEGDQRQPFVVCPHCGHDHVMRWSINRGEPDERRLVTWDNKGSTNDWDLDTARYSCPECGVAWSEGERLRAISKLRWKQTKPFSCCADHPDGGYQEPEKIGLWEDLIDDSDGQHIVAYAVCRACGERAVSNRHASFNASRLYSPKPLSDMVSKFKDAQGKIQDLQVFVNSHLAEPWREVRAIKLTADGLAAREEDYAFEVPDRVAILTAGVDVQDDRLEVEVVGWGRQYESWSVDYQVIIGDPNFPDVWIKLDELLKCTRLGIDGRRFQVSATCIDQQGHRTEAVRRYCLHRQTMNRWPIAGANETGNTVLPIWPKSARYVGGHKLATYQIGTTAAKTLLATQLARSMPGPMFCHFQRGRDPNWYTGLLAEKQMMISGVLRWRPKHEGIRNEPLDCRVYAMAALEGLKAQQRDDLLVEKLADRLGIGRTLTDSEMIRFASIEELQRIEEQTEVSLTTGRAKPVKGGRERVKSDGDSQEQKAEETAAESEQVKRKVANTSRVKLQSQPSDLQPRAPAGAPSRKKAPFRW